ncbi:Holliday junction resolvase RuvX [Pueribacillus sp. YX66]|uniref:Holliday junction resolvase RuvX n=1 Tax=Pueribacillus sp. YX66 TaxID=3229242 RepID=UPI00358D371B
MRKMGLDLGTKTIGVAISDELGWTAQGIETVTRNKDIEKDLERLDYLIKEHNVSEIVLGYPKNMNGTVGERGQASEQFAELLKSRFQLPVHLWDERLTTVAAEKMLLDADVSRKKRKKVIDKLAAVIILQSYLDSRPIKRDLSGFYRPFE